MSIGSYAFNRCTSLESVDFSEVTSIGSYAFSGCTSLTNITVSCAVTDVTLNAAEVRSEAVRNFVHKYGEDVFHDEDTEGEDSQHYRVCTRDSYVDMHHCEFEVISGISADTYICEDCGYSYVVIKTKPLKLVAMVSGDHSDGDNNIIFKIVGRITSQPDGAVIYSTYKSVGVGDEDLINVPPGWYEILEIVPTEYSLVSVDGADRVALLDAMCNKDMTQSGSVIIFNNKLSRIGYFKSAVKSKIII